LGGDLGEKSFVGLAGSSKCLLCDMIDQQLKRLNSRQSQLHFAPSKSSSNPRMN
jgi:hypothetical protein